MNYSWELLKSHSSTPDFVFSLTRKVFLFVCWLVGLFEGLQLKYRTDFHKKYWEDGISISNFFHIGFFDILTNL